MLSKHILAFQKLGQFAVSNQKITPETMEAQRVLRRDPYKQLSRSLRGLPPSLVGFLKGSPVHPWNAYQPGWQIPISNEKK